MPLLLLLLLQEHVGLAMLLLWALTASGQGILAHQQQHHHHNQHQQGDGQVQSLLMEG